MAEQIIHSLLLALHNIALAGCAAAPFYNRALVLKRGQYGPKLYYEMDKVVEETLQGNAPYCITFITTLIITGIAMPLNYYLFNGTFRATNAVVIIALVVKLIAVAGMVVIMLRIFYRINPQLKYFL
jgi:hypothetical protein